MADETKCKGHERVVLMNAICERDKIIDDLKWEHAREIAEKDRMIAY